MGKLKEAIKDLKTVLKLSPKDATASAKLSAAEKEFRRRQFEQAIAVDDSRRSALERLGDIDAIIVEPSYDGPHLDPPVASTESGFAPCVTLTAEFISALIKYLIGQGKLHRKYLYQMLRHLKAILEQGASVVDVPVPESDKGVVNLVGDVHGQFYDVVNMLERCGMPGPANYYLFNGDFVDRGSFSVEVIVLLIALKLAFPKFVHLARGNHEADDMNKVYGFEGEVKSKYSDLAFRFFSEIFEALPVAHLVGGKIFVVHGGLSREGEEKAVTLDDLRALPRNSQPSGNPVLSDLLWADPSPIPGYTASKRGQGFQFGPDITSKFLERNGWDLVVRSHEVKEEGYEVQQNGKLITVFSAPNYCDQMGNKAAVIRVSSTSYPAPPLQLPPPTPTSTSTLHSSPTPPKSDWSVAETMTIASGKLRLEVRTFSHVGHPPVKAMAFSPMGAGMMS
ncbi:protein phosphatase 5 [Gonapodya prolifera JEL478]|uniref:protein-serine/threonine phosphatase n=1 Tax=Gonapodya prolifera (strain JEL478) TaxID=1344416 RepID=A0A139AT22_GONPJ|nr:protein phosphatase 5 [Gonapodya prolifera JEL478]|eukprot:KXS19887.1 protein phosphatase 5 [Gonapodya prolifera JEL478]